MNRYIRNILINTAVLIPLVLGLVLGVEWLKTITIGLLWAMSIMSISIVAMPASTINKYVESILTSNESEARIAEAHDTLYSLQNLVYDVALGAWLWNLGYPNLSIVYILHIVGYQYLMKRVRDETSGRQVT